MLIEASVQISIVLSMSNLGIGWLRNYLITKLLAHVTQKTKPLSTSPLLGERTVTGQKKSIPLSRDGSLP